MLKGHKTRQAGDPQADGAATDLGAADAQGLADAYPVEAGVDESSPREPSTSRPTAAISYSALPGPRMPAILQILGYWFRPTAFMERCRARYGSRFALRVRLPPKPLVVLSSSDDIKQMFRAPADVLYAGDGSVTIEKYTGQTGLAWLDEDEHLARRKLVNPSMHGKAMQRIAAAIADITEREVSSWPRDEVIAVHPLVHRLTLNVMRQVTFGAQPDQRLDELIDVLTEMMRFNESPVSVFKIHSMPPKAVRLLTAFRPSGLHRFLELRARADRLIGDVVEDRRRAGGDGEDLVSLLLSTTDDDGLPLRTVELRDEVMTIFLAGTETTAATIAWAIEHLSREHAVRERLVNEIDAGEDDAYLTATVQEMLRLRPPLPQIIPREVMKPIEIGGVRYDPGVYLWASPYLLHHDPSIYPDPYSFRPERFLEKAPGTYTWIPFGGGRRRCLGAGIATLESKYVLREVLSRYELRRESPQPEGTRSRIIIITPARGARVALSDRS
jgi:cytochrome P450